MSSNIALYVYDQNRIKPKIFYFNEEKRSSQQSNGPFYILKKKS